MTTNRAGIGDLPDPDQRATLNAALTANGTETGFWDQHGTPAPWPDDIDNWRPVTTRPAPSDPASPEDQPNTTPRNLTLTRL